MKTLFTLALFLSLACGQEKSEEEQPAATEPEPTQEVILGVPTYELGSCQEEHGCIKGFISHGMELTIEPEAASFPNHKGVEVSLDTYRFKDAQDFGDRFDTAFLKPLVDQKELDRYQFTITPQVTRSNFAEGFELFSEGLSASDDALRMGGEGNFSLGGIYSYSDVALRVVKNFRIEISKSSKEADNDAEAYSVVCLEIEASLDGLEVEDGKATNVGGLRNFQFYYTEDASYCALDNVLGQGRSPSQARTLPATTPGFP